MKNVNTIPNPEPSTQNQSGVTKPDSSRPHADANPPPNPSGTAKRSKKYRESQHTTTPPPSLLPKAYGGCARTPEKDHDETMTTTTNRQELPASVRATIGDGAMAKVSRFFNGTVTDVLLELFQNARRAGASEVRVTTEADPDAAGTTRVLVSDNGQGIADPSTLLAFGDSGWNQETARAEDPAGMGLYSLAGRPGRCRIESSTAASGPWAVTLEAVHFTGEKTADIEQGDRDTVGTEIRFDVRKRDHNEPVAKVIESAVETAARYQLIDVTLNGAVMKRKRITDKSIDTHV